MNDVDTRAGADPAETKCADGPSHRERLATDLAGIHTLLCEVVRVGNDIENYYLPQRFEAMNLAARLLKATSAASMVLARLNNEIPESRHRLIVEHTAPQDGNTIDGTTPSIGTPSKILKTTSGPQAR